MSANTMSSAAQPKPQLLEEVTLEMPQKNNVNAAPAKGPGGPSWKTLAHTSLTLALLAAVVVLAVQVWDDHKESDSPVQSTAAGITEGNSYTDCH